MSSSDAAAKKNAVEPVHIISALLSSTVEVFLIVALIFIIRAEPVVEVEEKPLKMEIVLSENYTNSYDENTAAEVKETENTKTDSEIPAPVFDPIFEALNTFKRADKLPESGETTSGFNIVEKQVADVLVAPDTIIPIGNVSVGELTNSRSAKKMKKISSFTPSETGERISFNNLEQYFPNFSVAQQGLNRDYNALLNKIPKPNLQNLQGMVIANMTLKEDGNVDVGIVSAPSPELSNLVLKNLKLLRTGQRIGELSFTVEINFVGSKS